MVLIEGSESPYYLLVAGATRLKCFFFRFLGASLWPHLFGATGVAVEMAKGAVFSHIDVNLIIQYYKNRPRIPK